MSKGRYYIDYVMYKNQVFPWKFTQPINFVSSNTKVAEIDFNGQIKGVSTGTAVITGQASKDKRANSYFTIKLTIIKELNYKRYFDSIDDEDAMIMTIGIPSNRLSNIIDALNSKSNTKRPKIGGNIVISSSDESIVTIENNKNYEYGIIHAHKPGCCKISISGDEGAVEWTIYVNPNEFRFVTNEEELTELCKLH